MIVDSSLKQRIDTADRDRMLVRIYDLDDPRSADVRSLIGLPREANGLSCSPSGHEAQPRCSRQTVDQRLWRCRLLAAAMPTPTTAQPAAHPSLVADVDRVGVPHSRRTQPRCHRPCQTDSRSRAALRAPVHLPMGRVDLPDHRWISTALKTSSKSPSPHLDALLKTPRPGSSDRIAQRLADRVLPGRHRGLPDVRQVSYPELHRRSRVRHPRSAPVRGAATARRATSKAAFGFRGLT